MHLLFLLLPLSCFAINYLPEEFTITERFFSLASSFDIACEEQQIATATKRLFALTPVYDLEDSECQPLATARARFFSWGSVADIEDPEGENLGRIEENSWRILPWGEYKVFDAENKEILRATMDFWGTEFTVMNPAAPDHLIATIRRPFIRLFRDHWTVHIYDHPLFEREALDPRILILLAVYQTDKDNRARFFQEYKTQLLKEFEKLE
jgi:uncharacterized protein YxjI